MRGRRILARHVTKPSCHQSVISLLSPSTGGPTKGKRSQDTSRLQLRKVSTCLAGSVASHAPALRKEIRGPPPPSPPGGAAAQRSSRGCRAEMPDSTPPDAWKSSHVLTQGVGAMSVQGRRVSHLAHLHGRTARPGQACKIWPSPSLPGPNVSRKLQGHGQSGGPGFQLWPSACSTPGKVPRYLAQGRSQPPSTCWVHLLPTCPCVSPLLAPFCQGATTHLGS
jgi:hypothetical protein